MINECITREQNIVLLINLAELMHNVSKSVLMWTPIRIELPYYVPSFECMDILKAERTSSKELNGLVENDVEVVELSVGS